jgi:hypothetical protein
MGGGLMQLVAYGAQDIYLTGNPQITFFKVVYRRHTNFSMETIQQTISGIPGPDGNSTVTISRNGDLVYKMYVTLDGTSVTKGSNIVSEVELEIGGQRIDRQYEEWMDIWNELSTPESKAVGLKAMQCDVGIGGNTGVGNVQVPLQFWFCRNPGLALPLIALQYHEVKLKFTWGSSHNGDVTKAQVWADYIYLDTDERRRFAQVSHEYLIEQIQKESLTDKAGDHKLNFNHPVKELIWTSTTDYTDSKLVLNGHDRFASQKKEYFQLRQPFDYHTAVPQQNLPSAALSAVSSTLTQIIKHSSALLGAEAAGADDDNIGGDPSSGKVKVSKLSAAVVPGATVPDSTKHEKITTSTDVDNANEIAYVVLNADINTLTTGDICEVTVSGANSNAGTKTCTVTSATTGSASNIAGTINSTILTFDQILVKSDFVNDSDIVFDITSILRHNNVNQARTSQMTPAINVYSFGLKPEEHQPSGTCNFSRIDNAKINFTAAQGAGNIYAVNYNVLRIMSGMGGLAYSN